LWGREDLSILDPCCGNGNFGIPIAFELLRHRHDKRAVLEQMEFNDINESRLENVRRVFCGDKYDLKITNHDFITFNNTKIRFNRRQPALRQTAGKRKTGVQNHNLIKVFIEKTLEQLKPNGYFLYYAGQLDVLCG
jgi:hypothetical protein